MLKSSTLSRSFLRIFAHPVLLTCWGSNIIYDHSRISRYGNQDTSCVVMQQSTHRTGTFQSLSLSLFLSGKFTYFKIGEPSFQQWHLTSRNGGCSLEAKMGVCACGTSTTASVWKSSMDLERWLPLTLFKQWRVPVEPLKICPLFWYVYWWVFVTHCHVAIPYFGRSRQLCVLGMCTLWNIWCLVWLIYFFGLSKPISFWQVGNDFGLEKFLN